MLQWFAGIFKQDFWSEQIDCMDFSHHM